MAVHPAPSAIALLFGAIAGALAFLLAALFVGAPLGALIALVATVVALRRRSAVTIAAFAMATILAAAATIAPTATLLLASGFFGLGLRASANEEVVGPRMSADEHRSVPTADDLETTGTEFTADEGG
jgi:hypothetical protein